MTISPKTFATALAALAIVVGLVLLFSPVSASADGQSIACGPVASPSGGPAVTDSVLGGTAAADACDSAHSSRGTAAWVVLGVGVVSLVGVRFVRWSPQPAA